MICLAVDASTTAVKVVAVTPEGLVRAIGRSAYDLKQPEPDAYEQDAEAWWRALVAATRDVLAQLGDASVAAVAVTHQRETFVICDEHGAPLGPAVVWMDSRGASDVQARVAGRADALHEETGKPPSITPSFYKLAALRRRSPKQLEAAARVTDVGGFLVHRLTGQWVTSVASADPMGLVDLKRRTWSSALAEELGLTTGQLPALVAPGSDVGPLSAAAQRALGLSATVRVVATAGDGQAAGLGAGVTAPGHAYLNLGTAIVSGVLSSEYRVARSFRTLLGAIPETYFLETDLLGGTFSVDWLLQSVLGIDDANERVALLEQSTASPGACDVMFLPYLAGVMNPHWDDQASACFVGLRGDHERTTLVRAVLEGLAYEVRSHLEAVEADTGHIERVTVLGGGTRNPGWLQILADVLGRPIELATTAEATALGAAVSGAVALGWHADWSAAAAAMTARGQRVRPGPNREIYDSLYRDVFVTLYPGLSGAMRRLSGHRHRA